MAAIYHESQGNTFDVPVGSLGFSVTIFCIEALLAIIILMLRRNPSVGGARAKLQQKGAEEITPKKRHRCEDCAQP